MNMLVSTRHNRGYMGVRKPGADLVGLTRMHNSILSNPKFNAISEDVYSTNPAATSSAANTTTQVLSPHPPSSSVNQSGIPGLVTNINPMSDSLDCSSDLGLGLQEGSPSEPATE